MYVLMLLSSTLKKELTFIWQFLFEFMDPFYILLNDLLNMWFKSERFPEKNKFKIFLQLLALGCD